MLNVSEILYLRVLFLPSPRINFLLTYIALLGMTRLCDSLLCVHMMQGSLITLIHLHELNTL